MAIQTQDRHSIQHIQTSVACPCITSETFVFLSYLSSYRPLRHPPPQRTASICSSRSSIGTPPIRSRKNSWVMTRERMLRNGGRLSSTRANLRGSMGRMAATYSLRRSWASLCSASTMAGSTRPGISAQKKKKKGKLNNHRHILFYRFQHQLYYKRRSCSYFLLNK